MAIFIADPVSTVTVGPRADTCTGLVRYSSDLSIVFNLQEAHRELVLCVLPLILSLRSLKRSIEGKPV